MKREKQLTKREKKALKPGRPQPAAAGGHDHHIHCVACGLHLDPSQFDAPATATYVRCQHGSQWAACAGCVPRAKELLAEHDRTGRPVQAAGAWH